LKQNLTTGIAVEPKSQLVDFCTPCLAGKQHRDPFPLASENRSTELLGRIHSDVHGPLQTQTPDGFRYWVTFVDDYSRYKEVYLLKHKSDAFSAFKTFVAKAERKLERKVKELRDDKGGEYISKEFDKWCEQQGIMRQHTVRATPQQNGVAERLNRTLAEGVIAILNQANLPTSFWGLAVKYVTHTLNVTPSSSTSNTTSYTVWNGGRKPDISMYRVFGCQVHVNILRKDRKNLEPHSEPCIFIGFADGYKGWKVYSPTTKKVQIARDVIFDETSFPGLSTKTKPYPKPPSVTLHDVWVDDIMDPLPSKEEPESGDEDDDDSDKSGDESSSDSGSDGDEQEENPTTPER
jgi:hypothetical protein